jgi:Domain of unknown function (DUF4398)
MRTIVGLLLVTLFGSVQADPAIARFAGAQLDMAERALEHARMAMQAQNYPLAYRLAAQAGLDARLAWSMTRSEVLRRAAMEVNRRAERLRWRGLVASGGGVP